MNDDLFYELLESVREGSAILRGEKPDVQQIRNKLRLSQSKFATLLGISLDTLQNWEQGRRSPRGPARILLQVAAKHPLIMTSRQIGDYELNFSIEKEQAEQMVLEAGNFIQEVEAWLNMRRLL